MELQHVLTALQGIAPLSLAAEWDRVGLQAGDPRQPVRRALLCIDLTSAVMAEAVRWRAGLVVAYHPPIFKPLTSLAIGRRGDWKQRLLVEAIRQGVAIYTPHTALDACVGGVNDWLCAGLGAGRVEAIEPANMALEHGGRDVTAGAGQSISGGGGPCKIVTFVPPEQVGAVRQAMAGAGAGVIGNYSECSFGSPGQGTFRGGEGSHPVIGRAGRLEAVGEVRLEMLCPRPRVAAVVAALRQAHPYEEPAFDVYRLEPPPMPDGSPPVGQGRLLHLAEPITAAALVRRVKHRLGLAKVEVALPARGHRGDRRASGRGLIRGIAVCAGAGGSLLEAAAGRCQAYLTGEMHHHDVLAATQDGKTVVLAGHTQSERPYLPEYRRRILATRAGAVAWRISRADAAPSVLQ